MQVTFLAKHITQVVDSSENLDSSIFENSGTAMVCFATNLVALLRQAAVISCYHPLVITS